MRRNGIAVAVALFVLSGCGGGTDTARVVLDGRVGTITLFVEVADSASERRQGLRGREKLRRDSGMLFLFDESVTTRFVMEDTQIPLSIAFIDKNGRIVAIRDMGSCPTDDCPTYGAPRPFSIALEVNRGAFERWQINVGDRMRIEPDRG